MREKLKKYRRDRVREETESAQERDPSFPTCTKPSSPVLPRFLPCSILPISHNCAILCLLFKKPTPACLISSPPNQKLQACVFILSQRTESDFLPLLVVTPGCRWCAVSEGLDFKWGQKLGCPDSSTWSLARSRLLACRLTHRSFTGWNCPCGHTQCSLMLLKKCSMVGDIKEPANWKPHSSVNSPNMWLTYAWAHTHKLRYNKKGDYKIMDPEWLLRFTLEADHLKFLPLAYILLLISLVPLEKNSCFQTFSVSQSMISCPPCSLESLPIRHLFPQPKSCQGHQRLSCYQIHWPNNLSLGSLGSLETHWMHFFFFEPFFRWPSRYSIHSSPVLNRYLMLKNKGWKRRILGSHRES